MQDEPGVVPYSTSDLRVPPLHPPPLVPSYTYIPRSHYYVTTTAHGYHLHYAPPLSEQSRSRSPSPISSSSIIPPSVSLRAPSSFAYPDKDQLAPPSDTHQHILQAGDIVYWHHLAKSGEIPGVTDDERARSPKCKNAMPFLNR